MTQDKSNPKSRCRSRKPKHKPDTVNVNRLESIGKEAADAHFRATNTSLAYKGHIKRAKEFTLKQINEETKEITEKKESDRLLNDEDEPQEGTEFEHSLSDDWDFDKLRIAWENPPNEYSSRALKMFLVFKCVVQGYGFGTAEQIRAAAIAHWDNMDSEKYRGKWEWDSSNSAGKGNPARTALIDDAMITIRNRWCSEGGVRNHSLAMSEPHMKKLIAWSESQYAMPSNMKQPMSHHSRDIAFKHLFMRAFSTSGFTIWSRNFELTNLQYKHVHLDCESPLPWRLPHFKVRLANRKGWQHRTAAEGPLEGHLYDIYPQPKYPHIDMSRHFLAWLDFLQFHVYNRSLHSDDYMFPAIGPNGVPHIGKNVSHETVQKWLTEFTEAAGLVKEGVGGTFTTHCFRRGGSQYRFLYAPIEERWNLAQVRWWGGWAEKENRDTLLKYLLDELERYEDHHGDSLCPIPRNTKMKTANPVDSPQVSNEAIMSVLKRLDRIEESIEKILLQSSHSQCCSTNAAAVVSVTTNALAALCHDHSASTPPCPVGLPTQSSRQAPGLDNVEPGLCIPDIRLSGREGYLEALKQWYYADEKQGLKVALKDWPASWYQTGPNKAAFATKRHNRSMIAEEFERCGSSSTAFELAYPAALQGQRRLLASILKARIARGDSKARISRKRKLSSID